MAISGSTPWERDVEHSSTQFSEALLTRRCIEGANVGRGVQRAKTSSAVPVQRWNDDKLAMGPGTASATLSVACGQAGVKDVPRGVEQIGRGTAVPSLTSQRQHGESSFLQRSMQDRRGTEERYGSRFSLGPSWTADSNLLLDRERRQAPSVNATQIAVEDSESGAKSRMQPRALQATTSAVSTTFTRSASPLPPTTFKSTPSLGVSPRSRNKEEASLRSAMVSARGAAHRTRSPDVCDPATHTSTPPMSLLHRPNHSSQRDSGGSGGESPGELSTDSTIATTGGRRAENRLSKCHGDCLHKAHETGGSTNLEQSVLVADRHSRRPYSSAASSPGITRRSVLGQEAMRRVRSSGGCGLGMSNAMQSSTALGSQEQLASTTSLRQLTRPRLPAERPQIRTSPSLQSNLSVPVTSGETEVHETSQQSPILRVPVFTEMPRRIRVPGGSPTGEESTNPQGAQSIHLIPALRRSPLEAAIQQIPSSPMEPRISLRDSIPSRQDRRLRGLRSTTRTQEPGQIVNMSGENTVPFIVRNLSRRRHITTRIPPSYQPQSAFSGGSTQEPFSTGQIMSITSLLGTVDRQGSFKVGIDEKVLALLPISKFDAKKKGQLSGDHLQCMVCLMDFWDGDNLRWLPCLHHFHCECIDTWLRKSARTCPICKCDVEKSQPSTDNSQSDDCRGAFSARTNEPVLLRHTPQALGGATGLVNGSNLHHTTSERRTYQTNAMISFHQRAAHYSELRHTRSRAMETTSPQLLAETRLTAV